MSSTRDRSARPHAACALLRSTDSGLACPTPPGRAGGRLGRLPRAPPPRRPRAALARLHPSRELRPIALGHDLLQPRQHLTLFLAHVMLHAFLEGVDTSTDLAVVVPGRPQLGDQLLHACVLAQRFPDEPTEFWIRRGAC